jgi:transcriptional regulator with XRE-family HTH domain
LGVKQSELAKAAGVSLATLNNLERGIGDPRSSTLESIERALFLAGVETEADATSETVRLLRVARPSAYDTYHASQRILEALSRDSLLKVVSVRFYARRDHLARDQDGARRLCVLLEGGSRSLLFDQAAFSFESGGRVAEIAGILLAAFALHDGALYYLDREIEDTTLMPVAEAIDRLRAAPWEPLRHPRALIDLLQDWDAVAERYGARDGHPMADLIQRTGIGAAAVEGPSRPISDPIEDLPERE